KTLFASPRLARLRDVEAELFGRLLAANTAPDATEVASTIAAVPPPPVDSENVTVLAPNVISVRQWDRLLGGLLSAATPPVPWAPLLRRTFPAHQAPRRRRARGRGVHSGGSGQNFWKRAARVFGTHRRVAPLRRAACDATRTHG